MKTKHSRNITTRVQKSKVDPFDQVQFVVGIKRFFKRNSSNEANLRSTLTKFLRIFRSQLSDKANQKIAVQVLLEVLYKENIVDIPVLSRFLYVYQDLVKSDHDATLRNLYIWWTPGDEKVPEADILWDINQNVIPYTKWYKKFFSQMTINAVRNGRYDFLKFLLKRRLNIFPPQEAKPLIGLVDRFR